MNREELTELKELIIRMGVAFQALDITNECIGPDFDAIDSISKQIRQVRYFNHAPELGDSGMETLQHARAHYLKKAVKGDLEAFTDLKQSVQTSVAATLQLL